ncbi:hypothetical protein [Oscillibacter sp.]|uniref:hypothetical protein n=1 Tax=Oscillibacter sp. TaxID=1945593 RepID=UPI0028AA2DEB|nr:hypothetical protein [Oscillibacter sp.]
MSIIITSRRSISFLGKFIPLKRERTFRTEGPAPSRGGRKKVDKQVLKKILYFSVDKAVFLCYTDNCSERCGRHTTLQGKGFGGWALEKFIICVRFS